MEKRLRSSLQTSAESFLASAIKLSLKSAKPSLKSLIHNIKPSSDLCTSLPLSLHSSISRSINSFKNPTEPRTPPSPPSKKPRRPSRNSVAHDEKAPETHQKCLLQNLQIYAYVSLICVKHPKGAFSPQDLFPAVRELHDNLILFESDSVLLSEISNLCEEWWKGELTGREMLISQFLPFLVSRSLTLRKKVDVHRVYALREAFVLFDFEDESIEDLKLLLGRCVITPLYLKTEDGRKFIAFMFGLSLQLLKESLALIKSQIPFGRKSMLEAYGEIVFRGWKSVDCDLRREIEDGFLQSLIEGATLSSSASLAASIRRVLGAFTNQRTTDGVEKLLFRLAEPVIFRSLQVANSNVRHNTLHLLLDMFPLEDPEATKEVKDTLLHKQFFLLEKLLKDDCPDVRLVAVEGCCRILHLFWEIIPSSTITKMITIIFDDMSRDASNDVRLSTLNGIIYLLGNPQAHELLKVLLPRLGNMILDPVLAIRIAVTDLLLLIMDVRGFQFNKVVNLDVLLTTLANDQPPVAEKITQLLLPSYFPSKVDKAEACTRFVTLIKRAPMAGARFCEFAATSGASSKYLLELVRVLTSMVLSPDRVDSNLNKGIFVAVSHLCSSLVKESSPRVALKELFPSEKLKGLLAVAASSHAQSSLFDIISVVSPVGISGLLEECITVVTNCRGLSEDNERQTEVKSVHKLVLSANWFDDMFEALTALVQDTAVECGSYFGIEIPKQLIPITKRKKGSSSKMTRKGKCGDGKRPLGFKDNYQNSVGIVWQIRDLLTSESSRKAMFKSKALERAIASLQVISEVSIVHCMCCDFMDASLVDAYLTLSLLMSLQNISVDDVREHSSRKNNEMDSESSLEQQTVWAETLDHLLSCTDKIFSAGGLAKFGSMFSGCKQCSKRTDHPHKKRHVGSSRDASRADDGSAFSYRTRMLNMVKILTAVLKFIVDAASLNFLSHNQHKFLSFASAYLQNMISTLKRSFHDEVKFQEEQLREIHACLKSSFSYAAKLLNVTLASVNEDSPAPLEAYDVANQLLNLIASIELYCGSGCASRFVTLAKQWLPDVILGLGSRCMQKDSLEDIISLLVSNEGEMHIHPWLSILANIELHEMRYADLDEEDSDKAGEKEKFPAFKKLIELIIQVLRIKHEVLDIVGLIFLIGSATGLQRKELGLVSGLVHFVIVKLVGNEDTHLGKLNMILAYLQELYPQVENCLEETENSEDEVQELLSIKASLERVWLYSCEMKGVA